MWDWYPKPKPRRPANGIKAQSKQFGKTWWASRWLDALYKLIDPGRLQRGRSYARSGQVLNLDIQTGRVDARVQGSRPQPYKVWLKIKPLTETDWSRVAEAMSAQAIFAAKLLAGEMPQNIEEAFTAARVNLFPTSRNDLETECSCPDWSNPCKHVAAVYLLLGEQFDADPFLIFRLRGKSKNEIMEMLRARRAAETPAHAKAQAARAKKPRASKAPKGKSEPLEKSLGAFWSSADLLEDFSVNVRAAEIDAAAVKRLGAPGFWRGKQEFQFLMERAYRDVTRAALELTRE
ncbi:MAG: hypothetical protein DCC52_08400 [Chloroflexi bacterium]|nr:MAG: hypothetical protein DCC52_08400 [Chloroflexota bacterium]